MRMNCSAYCRSRSSFWRSDSAFSPPPETSAREVIDERQSEPPSDLSGRYLVKTFRELFRAWNERLERQE